MVALVKVVPFGVPQARVIDVERIAQAGAAILRVQPLQAKRVALIVSGTDATRERLLRSFHAPVRQRIEGWGSQLLTSRPSWRMTRIPSLPPSARTATPT